MQSWLYAGVDAEGALEFAAVRPILGRTRRGQRIVGGADGLYRVLKASKYRARSREPPPEAQGPAFRRAAE